MSNNKYKKINKKDTQKMIYLNFNNFKKDKVDHILMVVYNSNNIYQMFLIKFKK